VLRRPANFLRWLNILLRTGYVTTNWRALVLSDLGLTSKDRRIGKIADLFFKYKLGLGSPINIYNEEVCIVGNTARLLTRFGYVEDFRVRKRSEEHTSELQSRSDLVCRLLLEK